MKRLLVILLAVVILAGCATPATVVGPSAATLSEGLKLHDIFDDVSKFSYAYDDLDGEAYDSYSIACGNASIDDFNIAMQKIKDAGFVEQARFEAMSTYSVYVGYKDDYQCYVCWVSGVFEMIIRPENYDELYDQWKAEQEANENG